MIKFLSGVAVVVAVVAAYLLRRRHTLISKIAPSLRTPMDWVPLTVNNKLALRVGRAMFSRASAVADGVSMNSHDISVAGATVRVYVYLPAKRREGSGALLWIHGGGLILGTARADHAWCSRIASDLQTTVVNVDYRLAPEHPFPASLRDCHDALRWLVANADQFGIDPNRIAVGGGSAGGGLAAALAQQAYDYGNIKVAFQLLQYPMLDDRTVKRAEARHERWPSWNPASNKYAWSSYLGHEPGLGSVPQYAAPARRVSLAGLPPAWIGVGDVDMFYDEDVNYARRLSAAGVDCELRVEQGFPHGADVAHGDKAPQTRAFRNAMIDALRPHV